MSAAPRLPLDEPRAGHAFPLLYQLVYCSRATPGVDDDAVHRIIRSARRRNPEQGITGLLVFGSGVFFQWLEGPRDSVTALMATLKADARHIYSKRVFFLDEDTWTVSYQDAYDTRKQLWRVAIHPLSGQWVALPVY